MNVLNENAASRNHLNGYLSDGKAHAYLDDCFRWSFYLQSRWGLHLQSQWGLILILLFWGLAGCEDKKHHHTFNGQVMGTTYAITIYDNKPLPVESLDKNFQIIFSDVKFDISNWTSASQISKINHAPLGEVINLNSHTLAVLNVYEQIRDVSKGALDPSIGELINLWGFGVKRHSRLPGQAQVEQLLSKLTQHDGGLPYILDKHAGTIVKRRICRLNLSAVAKGYTVDQIATLLKNRGYQCFLINIGGEIYAHGHKPQKAQPLVGVTQFFADGEERTVENPGVPWRVGVQYPDFIHVEPLEKVTLHNQALATSGNYQKFMEVRTGQTNERHTHILDPRTGYPIKHDLVSVTVRATSCALADGWATTLMVLGEDEGRQIAEMNPDIDAFFVRQSVDGSLLTSSTQGW